ncbi:MAG: isocitrate lyase/PEP mutase family protein [Candidatus Tectomicrobia bacterium]|uniref:Isocitrate lyase/PEP mutase family protein n=1 Tax=Tectimicrobiota bacterium TaxID=2528274 RepID=A0A937VZC5_UNCTE|nr:isocitrate lyase/PEP mutase family protein [Candidatus Tectomicrobia bacterium]
MTVHNFGVQQPVTALRTTTRLRQMLRSGTMVAAPFVLNAFHAQIAASAGFQAVYMTGFGTAAERGYPDVGLVTQTEMVQNARYIASAVDVPVLCDADTGYGNAINVTRTIREYEAAGVAGCHIEDQVFPKKCGFFEGKLVIPLEEHVQKIRAALAARRDPDFVVIARTDALAVNGWDDVVQRCRAYCEAGADLIFVDGIKTVEDLRTYAQALPDLPKMYNGMLLPIPEVERLGFRVMITGGTIGVICKAVQEAMHELQATGIVSASRLASRDEVTKVLGLAHVYELEHMYGNEMARA